MEMFIDHQISLYKWFLKDCVKIKSSVMATEKSDLPSPVGYIYIYHIFSLNQLIIIKHIQARSYINLNSVSLFTLNYIQLCIYIIAKLIGRPLLLPWSIKLWFYGGMVGLIQSLALLEPLYIRISNLSLGKDVPFIIFIVIWSGRWKCSSWNSRPCTTCTIWRTALLHYVILPPGEILDHINGSFSFWLLVVMS